MRVFSPFLLESFSKIKILLLKIWQHVDAHTFFFLMTKVSLLLAGLDKETGGWVTGFVLLEPVVTIARVRNPQKF